MKRINKYEIFLFIFSVIILVSCSTTTRYEILSTIFDGVPNPNAKQKEIADSLKADTLFTKNKLLTAKIKKTDFFYHPPYRKRLCNACHNVDKGNKLVKPMPGLCYTCHKNMTGKDPVIHGPVAMGDCLACHNPHLAKNKFLLKRKGRALCLYCHNPAVINKDKIHFASEELDCLDCHNPHSGKNKFLLN
ncbi:doubled CXXCH motif [bacterium BMS3Abin04]|nr:doubled CXXCH motif [bacterium BMS3Abin04]